MYLYLRCERKPFVPSIGSCRACCCLFSVSARMRAIELNAIAEKHWKALSDCNQWWLGNAIIICLLAHSEICHRGNESFFYSRASARAHTIASAYNCFAVDCLMPCAVIRKANQPHESTAKTNHIWIFLANGTQKHPHPHPRKWMLIKTYAELMIFAVA